MSDGKSFDFKRIFSYLLTFAGGVVIGRVTKTTPVRAIELISPIAISGQDELGATGEEVQAFLHFYRVMIAAFREAFADEGQILHEEEMVEIREAVTRKAFTSMEARGISIPLAVRLVVEGFLFEAFDPAGPDDVVSTSTLRLTSDFGDLLARMARANAEFSSDGEGIVNLLKSILRKWEAEGRPEAHVRPLRHLIGAIAASL